MKAPNSKIQHDDMAANKMTLSLQKRQSPTPLGVSNIGQTRTPRRGSDRPEHATLMCSKCTQDMERRIYLRSRIDNAGIEQSRTDRT